MHQMRVATRRMGSALATYRPLLDGRRSDEIRAELRWLAGLLGAARDAEVMRLRLTELVAKEPEELRDVTAIERLETLALDPQSIRRQAEAFDVAVFRARWRELLARLGVDRAVFAAPP